MKLRVRKIALVAHIASSVGWLGAAVAFMALAITGLTADEPRSMVSAVGAMEHLFFVLIVPFAVGTLLIAVVQSVLSPYGLFRHWWVAVKLALTALALVVVLMYGGTMRAIAVGASDPAVGADDLRPLLFSPLVHAGAGALVLVTSLVLSVYKPRGLTPIGWRWEDERRRRRSTVR